MKLDYDKIKESAELLNKVIINMKNKLESIETATNNIKYYWTSDSSNFLVANLKEEIQEVKDVLKELNNCYFYLQSVSNIYQDLEEFQKQKIITELESSIFFKIDWK